MWSGASRLSGVNNPMAKSGISLCTDDNDPENHCMEHYQSILNHPRATPYNDLDDYESQAMPDTSIPEDTLAITEIRQWCHCTEPMGKELSAVLSPISLLSVSGKVFAYVILVCIQLLRYKT